MPNPMPRLRTSLAAHSEHFVSRNNPGRHGSSRRQSLQSAWRWEIPRAWGPFFISPDERWICAKLHSHSQLDGVMLYRRKAGFQFELVTTDECEMRDQFPDWEFDSGDRFVDTSDWKDTAGVHDYFVARSEEHSLNSSHVRISYAVFCL